MGSIKQTSHILYNTCDFENITNITTRTKLEQLCAIDIVLQPDVLDLKMMPTQFVTPCTYLDSRQASPANDTHPYVNLTSFQLINTLKHIQKRI